MKKHILHRENCSALLRKSHTTKYGNKIALYGKHGFEWQTAVSLNRNCCLVSVTKFPNRLAAERHYNLLCQQY